MNRTFKVATRPSLLATTQTQQTVDLLRKLHPMHEFEIIPISTHGDKVVDKALTAFGGTGVFVKELENAILEGKADFAVHSLKDVPSVQPDGLSLVAFPQREDVRDLLLMRDGLTLNELADNCIIGTGSPRRIVQLTQLKPNAQFKDLRGNIDTRIQKLNAGEYDAIVLAAAGLNRLGRNKKEYLSLEINICIPAVGQGAIALECRSNDRETQKLLRSINDTATETAILAERSYMKTIGGGCKFPLGAHATIEGQKLKMEVMIGNHHTGQIIRLEGESNVNEAHQLGCSLAEKIIEQANEEGLIIIRNE